MSRVLRRNGNIEQIRCSCGTIIQDLVPSDKPMPQRRVGDVIIRDRLLVLHPLANYREITLLLDSPDGTKHKHVTHMCAACVDKINASDPEHLQKLEEHMRDDMDDLHGEGHVPPNVHNLWKQRTCHGVELPTKDIK